MARTINFEGRQITVPDDFSDDEVSYVLNGGPAVQAQPTPNVRASEFANSPAGQAPAPQPENRYVRGLNLGVQDVGRGLAKTIGGPVDLMTGALNLGIGGINKASKVIGYPTEMPPIEQPFMGSDFIRDKAGKAFEAAGGTLVGDEQRSRKERLIGDAVDFGTQALSTSVPMAVAGVARGATIAAGQSKQQLGDAFLRPYFANPASTVAGDVAAGVGAGVANDAVDEYVPEEYDSPLVRLFATLGGGAAGAATKEAATAIGRGIATGAQRVVSPNDPNIPLDRKTGQPVKRGQAETAARMMQEVSQNPDVAAANIRDAASVFRDANLPQPSIGLVSDDVGLQAAESAARTRSGVPFIENDNRLRAAATERVNSLRDLKANQSAVAARAKQMPVELAAERDAAAMPLLRQAEQNPAPVDTQPVIETINKTLATAKRPAVRNAMGEARGALNKPGTEDIDQSVKGLYESRKAINDIIEGRGDNPTGRYAQKELIAARDALDAEIAKVSPEFPEYLKTFKEKSVPLNDFNESPVAAKLLNGEDPRTLAKRLFTSGDYGVEKQLDEVKKIVAKDPEAARGWKAAVSEVLSDQVSGTAKIDAGRPGIGHNSQYRVELSKLDRMFKDNEALLAKVYGPEEMSKLHQAHAVLEPLKNATVRATAGSNTGDKAAQIWRLTEAGLKAKYGVLKGGGYLRTLRIMAQTLPDDSAAIHRVVERAWFDPDIAEYLLTMKVRDLDGPAANKYVMGLIAGSAAGRESAEGEPDDRKRLSIEIRKPPPGQN